MSWLSPSEVAEELVFHGPVHLWGSFLRPVGTGLLLLLSGRGAQPQSDLCEGV